MTTLWIATVGILLVVIGFAGGTLTYFIKNSLHFEDAEKVDPVPAANQQYLNH